MNNMAIQMSNVNFSYPGEKFKINIPEVTIAKGAQCAIIGPSGCGKTTLIKLIAGILKPPTGSILVNNQAVSDFSDAWRRNYRVKNIGFIFQQFELLEYLSIEDNILLPFYVNRSLKLNKEARISARELAETVGLSGKLRSRPNQLSQGERQRIAICRSLITNPLILLADEPTGNLDPDNTKLIMKLILEQVRNRKMTLAMITHDQLLLKDFKQIVDFRNPQPGGDEK